MNKYAAYRINGEVVHIKGRVAFFKGGKSCREESWGFKFARKELAAIARENRNVVLVCGQRDILLQDSNERAVRLLIRKELVPRIIDLESEGPFSIAATIGPRSQKASVAGLTEIRVGPKDILNWEIGR
ncbi:MAG: hypothetical protein KDA74_25545 [Planctomycetaceae bacterium]|nr:hypothetical protein [Planctomycetaceae bacterium]